MMGVRQQTENLGTRLVEVEVEVGQEQVVRKLLALTRFGSVQ